MTPHASPPPDAAAPARPRAWSAPCSSTTPLLAGGGVWAAAAARPARAPAATAAAAAAAATRARLPAPGRAARTAGWPGRTGSRWRPRRRADRRHGDRPARRRGARAASPPTAPGGRRAHRAVDDVPAERPGPRRRRRRPHPAHDGAQPQAAALLSAGLSPGDDRVVGVGQPVVVRLDRPVEGETARDALVDRLQVRATPAVDGAWRWMSSTELHYRGPTSGSRAARSASSPTSRPPAARRRLGQRPAHEHVHRRLARDQRRRHPPAHHDRPPRRQGPAGHEGVDGQARVRDPQRHLPRPREVRGPKVMDSDTLILPPGTPAYRTPVKHAVRISNSGTFTHGAPWSVQPGQGQRQPRLRQPLPRRREVVLRAGAARRRRPGRRQHPRAARVRRRQHGLEHVRSPHWKAGALTPSPARGRAPHDRLPDVRRHGHHAAVVRRLHRPHRPELPAPRAARLPRQGAVVAAAHRARAAAARPAAAGRRRAHPPARRPLRPGRPPGARPRPAGRHDPPLGAPAAPLGLRAGRRARHVADARAGQGRRPAAGHGRARPARARPRAGAAAAR